MKSLIASTLLTSGNLTTGSYLQPQASGWHKVSFLYCHPSQGNMALSVDSGVNFTYRTGIRLSDMKPFVAWSGDGTEANYATGTGGVLFGSATTARTGWTMLDLYLTGGNAGISLNGGTAATSAATIGTSAFPFVIGGSPSTGDSQWGTGVGAQYYFNRQLTRGVGSELEWLYNGGLGRDYAAVAAHGSLGTVLVHAFDFGTILPGDTTYTANLGGTVLVPRYITNGERSGQPWIGHGPELATPTWHLATVPAGWYYGATWDTDNVNPDVNFDTAASSFGGFIYVVDTALAPAVPNYPGSPDDGHRRDPSTCQNTDGNIYQARSNYGPEPLYIGTSIVVEKLTSEDGVNGPFAWENTCVIPAAEEINDLPGEGFLNPGTCVTSSPEWLPFDLLPNGRRRLFLMHQPDGNEPADAPASNSLFYYTDSVDSTMTAFGGMHRITGSKMPTRAMDGYIQINGGPTGTITAAGSNGFQDTATNFRVVNSENWIGSMVRITSGLGIGQERLIATQPTNDILLCTEDWDIVPAPGDGWEIFVQCWSVIDPTPYKQPDGSWLLVGRGFQSGNRVETWFGAIAWRSTTSSVSGYDEVFLLSGFGRFPAAIGNFPREGFFFLPNDNGDGGVTLAGDSNPTFIYSPSDAGEDEVVEGTYNDDPFLNSFIPPGMTSIRHFTPVKLTRALGDVDPDGGGLDAGTLSGPTSVTKSRLNGMSYTAATGGTEPYTYQGQRKKTADALWANVPDSSSSPFDVKSLLADTQYQVRVRVTDAVLDEVYTNIITATTDEAPPPPAPGGDDMASFPGLVLYYEPVTYDKDLGGPGCMWGLRVAAAGTVVATQRDGEDMSFVLAAPGNIQGDFTRVRGTDDGTDVDEEDITVARR